MSLCARGRACYARVRPHVSQRERWARTGGARDRRVDTCPTRERETKKRLTFLSFSLVRVAFFL